MFPPWWFWRLLVVTAMLSWLLATLGVVTPVYWRWCGAVLLAGLVVRWMWRRRRAERNVSNEKGR